MASDLHRNGNPLTSDVEETESSDKCRKSSSKLDEEIAVVIEEDSTLNLSEEKGNASRNACSDDSNKISYLQTKMSKWKKVLLPTGTIEKLVYLNFVSTFRNIYL